MTTVHVSAVPENDSQNRDLPGKDLSNATATASALVPAYSRSSGRQILKDRYRLTCPSSAWFSTPDTAAGTWARWGARA